MHVGKLKKDFLDRKSKKPGVYEDGGGLRLRVYSKTSASWLFRYMLGGKRHEISLGPFPEIGVDEAREKAEEARRLKSRGGKPISRIAAVRASLRASDDKFKSVAEDYIAANEPGWRNPKHRQQWKNTLATYVYPIIGNKPVSEIDTAMVAKVLKPIWNGKLETAHRVRGRIEAVLDRAKALNLREGENPAAWAGNLAHVLPPQKRKEKHHAALPYKDMPAFWTALQAEGGLAADTLRFTILTAARTGEALGATWDEFDIENGIWTVPAERMKAHREHLVPLSAPVLAILKAQKKATGGEGFVFPGMRRDRPLSNMAMLQTLRRMGRDDLTVHGFRSTFRVWAAEKTNFPRDACERALAHATQDKTEASYERNTQLFEKRVLLMDAWGWFATTPPAAESANVVPIGNAKATATA